MDSALSEGLSTVGGTQHCRGLSTVGHAPAGVGHAPAGVGRVQTVSKSAKVLTVSVVSGVQFSLGALQ